MQRLRVYGWLWRVAVLVLLLAMVSLPVGRVVEAEPESRPNIIVMMSDDMGWSDIGSWSAVWKEGPQDADGNVALGDVLAPTDIALEAYERALQPKRLLMLDGGHFDPYTGDLFNQNSAAQRDWFAEHLKP